jgi:hypothetical protein
MALRLTVEDIYLWDLPMLQDQDSNARFIGHVRMRIQPYATDEASVQITIPFENARSIIDAVAWALHPIMHHGLELRAAADKLQQFASTGTAVAAAD